MTKRIKSIIMAVMMLATVLAVSGSDVKDVYAEGDITVTFHYNRADGVYDSQHYSLGIWTDVQGGIQYLFFDASGTTSVTLVGNPTELGFFVKDVEASKKASAEGGSGIVKDTGADRYIDLKGVEGNSLVITLTEGQAEVETYEGSSSELEKVTVPPASENEGDFETVTQMTSDDPKADYTPASATIIVVDLIIIVGVAVLSYVIYSKQKNPITDNLVNKK